MKQDKSTSKLLKILKTKDSDLLLRMVQKYARKNEYRLEIKYYDELVLDDDCFFLHNLPFKAYLENSNKRPPQIHAQSNSFLGLLQSLIQTTWCFDKSIIK